ncbi:LTXXQ domain protein [Pseudomonas mangiferae]|uniref:LTXXQ domain protein n=1 Tax=Pseudomonas mangiferae TaxID=2593654 RepID=A0A553H274_9PSED|nr:LTXXQ domain protein [Pseudomonas mangiferae]TRX75842.1 LTXXQ domain protein [Pseudomonas mangiferae]
MKKTLSALLFAVALPGLALAGPNHGPMGGPPGRDFGGMQILGDLDLNRDQRREVGILMAEQMKSRREITERYLDKLPAADRQAMENEIKASKDKTDAAIQAKLTPEQQKRFAENQKRQADRREEWKEFQAWKAQKVSQLDR